MSTHPLLDVHPRRAVGRPRNVDADEAILGAALKLLAEQGYERMSVDAVAHAAGVSKATVYRRWPTKNDLVEAAVCAVDELDTNGDPRHMRDFLVESLTGFQVRMLSQDGVAIVAALYLRQREEPELLQNFRERVIWPCRARMEACMAAAAARGELRQGLDYQLVLDMIFGSWLDRALTGRPHPEDWPERVVATIWPALEA